MLYLLYYKRLEIVRFSLRTLRESLRSLRLNFYRKERKGLRKGRREKDQSEPVCSIQCQHVATPTEGI